MSTHFPSFNSLISDLCLLSLEDSCMVSLAKLLLEQEEVTKILLQHFLHKNPSLALSIKKVEKIRRALKSLQVADILESKLVCIVQWVTDQYFQWIYYATKKISLNDRFSNKMDFIDYVIDSMKWNSNGTVDYQRSVHKLLKKVNEGDESLTVKFEIASQYCLEQDIKELWGQLSSSAKKNILEKEQTGHCYCFTLYWACTMSGEMDKFSRCVSKYLKRNSEFYFQALESEMDFVNEFGGDANNCAFVIAVFEGSSSAINYFCGKLSDFETSNFVLLTEVYLQNFGSNGWGRNYEDVYVLYYLLSKIKDSDIVRRIYNKFCGTFLKLSAKYWLCHKLLVSFLKISSDGIDQVVFYDVMEQLLLDVQKEKTDLILVKNLWRNIPSEVKRSFCSYISKKQKRRNCGNLWKNVTIEVIDLFMRDEESKNILMPYENNGIVELIIVQKYIVINHWLKKCLISEEAILCFMENFLITKGAEIIKYLNRFPLARINQFLHWGFKQEDFMNKAEIWQVKGEAVKQIAVATFLKGVKGKKWEDLKIFINWFVRNQNDCEDELISLKNGVLKELFKKGMISWKESNFVKKFKEFLSYGSDSTDKLKIVMKEIDVNESKFCSEMLLNKDWWSVEAFLEFLTEYDRDIWKIKENVVIYIFSNKEDVNFKTESYYKNVNKLLCWNSDGDVKKKIWEMKKLIIEKYGRKNIFKRMRRGSFRALNNILKFFFEEDKVEDEDYGKVFYDLKINIIKKLTICDSFWEKGYDFTAMLDLMNWGRNDENIKKCIWAAKKFFIERFKKNVKAEIIPDLILLGKNNFIRALFEFEKDESDYEDTLWDMEQFLLKKLIKDVNHWLTCLLFEKFEEFTEFLNWSDFSEERMMSLKKWIFDEKGIDCCLHWISEDKFVEINCFIDWCIARDADFYSNFLKFKENVLEYVLWKYPEKWSKEFFERLDKFLLIHFNDAHKDTKNNIVENFAAKGCCDRLSSGDVAVVQDFCEWAFEGNKESIENLKRKILKEVLNVQNVGCCKGEINSLHERDYFYTAVDEFLYKYQNPDPSMISNMKLDHIELYYDAVFTELLSKKMDVNLKSFLTWILDEHIKSEEFRPRVRKLTKEIFEKFGKEYCVLMLAESDWKSAVDFWDFSFQFQTNEKNMKSLLWGFKKECIKQAIDDEVDYDIYYEKFWVSLNKFINWGPTTAKLKSEIHGFKEMIRRENGIIIIKRSVEAYVLHEDDDEPKYFLKWLFGNKNQNAKTNLDEEALIDFKKEILESLINAGNQALLKKSEFYNVLNEIVKFNATDSVLIKNLKRSVVEVEGVKLCINLICKNYVRTLKRFLKWANPLFNGDVLDFKRSVPTELAENLTLKYSWESLNTFLCYGFNFETEQDREKYSILKSYVSESCGVDICYNWILKNQWDDIAAFIEWGFEPPEIKNLRNRLIDKHGPDYCNARIFDNDWEKLEKFLNWSFEPHENNEKEEQIINLKIKTLNKENCYKNHLGILMIFLEYGFASKASLNKFKKSILKKNHPLNYFIAKQKYKSHTNFQIWFGNK